MREFPAMSEEARKFVEAMAQELDAWRAQALQKDNPNLDCTDFAHPAWWRGCHYGCDSTVNVIEKALDGKDDGAGTFGSQELEAVRRRILEMVGRSSR